MRKNNRWGDSEPRSMGMWPWDTQFHQYNPGRHSLSATQMPCCCWGNGCRIGGMSQSSDWWSWDVNTERPESALLLTSSTVLSLHRKVKIQSPEGWGSVPCCGGEGLPLSLLLLVPGWCPGPPATQVQPVTQSSVSQQGNLGGFPIVFPRVSLCCCHANLRDRFSYCSLDKDSPQLRKREGSMPLYATAACQTGLATLQGLQVKTDWRSDAVTRTGICRVVTAFIS